MSPTENTFTLPEFPQNDRASRLWAQVGHQVERLHDAFMGQWRQALNAILPGRVEIDGVDLACKPYSTFVKDAAALSDIQVYEVEALQSLAAWNLDVGFVSAAVDNMFGGTGRAHLHEVKRRQRSPIETGVRRRLFESLATAYESVWQGLHPIRLNSLRQEALLTSLRLTSAAEHVLHARFRIMLNEQDFALELCLPLRALEVLQTPAPVATDLAQAQAAASTVSQPVQPTPPNLQDAPVEVVASLGELQLTVAQLMSLSIGQVLPFQMNEQVSLQVDGVQVVRGRSGVRNGCHAVKVELSEPVKLQGLKAEFTPLVAGLHTTEDSAPSVPQTSALAAEDVLASQSPSMNSTNDILHELNPIQ